MKYEHIRRAVEETPWAIRPHVLAAIVDMLSVRASGEHFSAAEIAERIGAGPPQREPQRTGSVAILPLYGVLAPKATMMTDISGGTSLAAFRGAFKAAVADENIASILLDVDSPGGNVEGVPETADAIFASRGTKPILALANTQAASAAYWIASQADELYVTPSGMVGSIGVFTTHDDLSAAAEMEGVKRTYISAGKYKTEGNPFEPLSEEAKAAAQKIVDEYYDMFVGAVAAGRATSAETVREDFGQGRMVTASVAERSSMVDGVATFEQTLLRLMPPTQASALSNARRSIAIKEKRLHLAAMATGGHR